MSKQTVQSVPAEENARRVKALQETGGKIAAAARLLKIPRATLSDWYHHNDAAKPAHKIKRGRKVGASLENSVDDSLKSLQDQIKVLEGERDQALDQLARARTTKLLEPLRTTKPYKRGKDDFVRVVIPDSHGSHIARNAAAATIADIKALDPDEIVMLGDHLDCGGFLAQHHTLGFVAETESTFEQDVLACNVFLDQIQQAAPRAKIHYLEGNHESRLEKWCITQTLRNKQDSAFLLSVFGPEAVLRLKQRGIAYYHSGSRYHDLPVPGTIRLGKCHFTHGVACGIHATHTHAVKFGTSIWHGHTHRAQSTILRTVGAGVIGAWSPGCLSQIQPLYMATNPSDWSHGYGLNFVARSEKFLSLNVPIIDGESLMLAALGKVRA